MKLIVHGNIEVLTSWNFSISEIGDDGGGEMM